MSTRNGQGDRVVWALFMAGPLIWGAHFMSVYLVAEAVCAVGAGNARVLGLQAVSMATLAATVVAGAATLVAARWSYRYWQARRDPGSDWLDGDDQNPGLALAGVLLALVFLAAILFVGVPAAFLAPC